MICKKCGGNVHIYAEKCPNCGAVIRRGSKDEAEKTTAQAEADAQILQEEEYLENKSLARITERGKQYLAEGQLWSSLKKESRRQRFYTNELSQETKDSFVNDVKLKMEQNHVSASIVKRQVKWDSSGILQEVYMVVPRTTVMNPVAYLIQFDKVGKYTFVEEKEFILPPKLPAYPSKRKQVDESHTATYASTIMWGIVLFGLGMLTSSNYYAKTFSTIAGILGLLLIGIGAWLLYTENQKINETKAHNAQVDIQEKNWNDAWSNWERTILTYAFQEDVNGRLSRIFDAVFGCIEQVNEEKFGSLAMEAEAEKTKLNEIEELVQRKKSLNR